MRKLELQTSMMLCAGEKFEGGVGLGSMDDSVGREGGAARRGAGRSEAEGVGGRVGEGGGAERGGERGSGRGRGEPIRLQYAYSYIQLYTRTYLLGWGTRGFRGELPLPPRAKQGRMMVRIGWRLWTVSRDKNASRRTARQHAFYAGPFADFVWQVRCVVLATGAEPKAAPVPNALSAEDLRRGWGARHSDFGRARTSRLCRSVEARTHCANIYGQISAWPCSGQGPIMRVEGEGRKRFTAV